ncbi:TMEM170 family protein [Abortiporus biennis]
MTTPSWPSLYDIVIEIEPISHRDPIQPGGRYLHNANDIYIFTLYWTLIFYTPAFVFCGIYAFLNLTFPASRSDSNIQKGKKEARPLLFTSSKNRARSRSHPNGQSPQLQNQTHTQLTTRSSLSPDMGLGLSPTSHTHPHNPYSSSRSQTPRSGGFQRPKQNEGRSRLTFALLVLTAFLFFGFAGAVVGSAVIGFTLAGLFKAGKFNMSTWIPFFGGLIQALVALLGLWPAVIDII